MDRSEAAAQGTKPTKHSHMYVTMQTREAAVEEVNMLVRFRAEECRRKFSSFMTSHVAFCHLSSSLPMILQC